MDSELEKNKYEKIFFKEADKSDLENSGFELASFFNLKKPIELDDNKIIYLTILLVCHAESVSESIKTSDLSENQKILKRVHDDNSRKNEVIGFLEISRVLDESDIIDLEIKNEFRRQRIGTEFLEYAISDMKLKGVKDIFLEVRKSNIAAIKLYEKLGFAKINIRNDYYSMPTEDAIIMVKKL